MDNRFPNWLKIVLRKLDFIGLPNIGMFVCGLSILGFFGLNFLGAPLERFIFDPYLVQHHVEQCRFIFAIAVPAGQYVVGRMWLKPTDSNFDRDISNIMLHIEGEPANLFQRICCSSHNLASFVANC